MTTRTTDGVLRTGERRTHYRVVGDLGADARPLVALHGGPGLSLETLEPLAAFARPGRPVVFYDQLGSGASDPPTADAGWSIAGFVEQLEEIRTGLGLRDIQLLGHSWGGMLALAYVLEHPEHVQSLILHSSIASASHCAQERSTFRETVVPAELRDSLACHETSGTTDHPAYVAVRQRFDELYCCRSVPWPAYFRRAVETMNVQTSQIVWAPSRVHPRGLAADWDIRPRLGEVSAPALVIAGALDGYAPGQADLFMAGLPNAQLAVFEQSSHYAHIEETAFFVNRVDRFLAELGGRTRFIDSAP
jgi:proline-specific peptidase